MDTQMKKDLPDIYKFYEMLSEHTWSFKTDNFRDFTKACYEEQKLYSIARSSGVEHTRAYAEAMKYAVSSIADERSHKARLETHESVSKLIPTGDEEFDLFRKDVNQIDWYAHYSDDGGVARRGAEHRDRVLKIAHNNGGLYLTYYYYALKRATNHVKD